MLRSRWPAGGSSAFVFLSIASALAIHHCSWPKPTNLLRHFASHRLDIGICTFGHAPVDIEARCGKVVGVTMRPAAAYGAQQLNGHVLTSTTTQSPPTAADHQEQDRRGGVAQVTRRVTRNGARSLAEGVEVMERVDEEDSSRGHDSDADDAGSSYAGSINDLTENERHRQQQSAKFLPRLSDYVLSLRPWSFSASLTPVALG